MGMYAHILICHMLVFLQRSLPNTSDSRTLVAPHVVMKLAYAVYVHARQFTKLHIPFIHRKSHDPYGRCPHLTGLLLRN